MKTLAQEFEGYCRHVYPDGTVPDQRKQVNEAFIAGAFLVLAFMDRRDKTEAETIEVYEAWYEEAKEFAMAVIREEREKRVKR